MYGEMEGTLLEGEEIGGGGVGASSLGENEDGLACRPHGLSGRVECGARGGAVCTVDEDGLGQRHEPTQKWRVLE